MLRKVFTLKYFCIGLVFGGGLLALGLSMSKAASGTDQTAYPLFLILLGSAGLLFALYELIKRVSGMISVRRAPDYREMAEDFESATPYFRKKVYLGNRYLFSPFAGRILLCRNIRNISQSVTRTLRNGDKAELSAMHGGESVVIARYTYRDDSAGELEGLERKLQAIRGKSREAAAPVSLRDLGPALLKPSEAAAAPAADAGAPQATAGAADGLPRQQDQRTAGRGGEASREAVSWTALVEEQIRQREESREESGNEMAYEVYLSPADMPFGITLFISIVFGTAFTMMFGAITVIMIFGQYPYWPFILLALWLVNMGLAFLLVRLINRRKQAGTRAALRNYRDPESIQADFATAMRNQSDTLRLGKKYLFVRNREVLIGYKDIGWIHSTLLDKDSGLYLQMTVNSAGFSTVDINVNDIHFRFPDGKRMDRREFEAFLQEHNPRMRGR